MISMVARLIKYFLELPAEGWKTHWSLLIIPFCKIYDVFIFFLKTACLSLNFLIRIRITKVPAYV